MAKQSQLYGCRPPGGAGGAMAPPDFGRLVNPISTRGTDYAHYWHPRIFRPSDGPEYTVGEITTLKMQQTFLEIKKMSSNQEYIL